ncbi:uncharacterized protein LOC119686128 [Teleopsis dalmanni]|uniref:uncharacterized protein LOC119686128 n=1 Tax=Teleopsis dalmanni TaxID=139649 RepID=UPI0018CC871C|nr:uncharacterized protein LOC119686128 [Teleopsis dalmanni]
MSETHKDFLDLNNATLTWKRDSHGVESGKIQNCKAIKRKKKSSTCECLDLFRNLQQGNTIPEKTALQFPHHKHHGSQIMENSTEPITEFLYENGTEAVEEINCQNYALGNAMKSIITDCIPVIKESSLKIPACIQMENSQTKSKTKLTEVSIDNSSSSFLPDFIKPETAYDPLKFRSIKNLNKYLLSANMHDQSEGNAKEVNKNYVCNVKSSFNKNSTHIVEEELREEVETCSLYRYAEAYTEECNSENVESSESCSDNEEIKLKCIAQKQDLPPCSLNKSMNALKIGRGLKIDDKFAKYFGITTFQTKIESQPHSTKFKNGSPAVMSNHNIYKCSLEGLKSGVMSRLDDRHAKYFGVPERKVKKENDNTKKSIGTSKKYTENVENGVIKHQKIVENNYSRESGTSMINKPVLKACSITNKFICTVPYVKVNNFDDILISDEEYRNTLTDFDRLFVFKA